MKMTRVHARNYRLKSRGDFLRKVGRTVDRAILSLFPGWGKRRIISRTRAELIERQAIRLGVSWTRPDRVRDSRWLVTGLSPSSVIDLDIDDLQNRCEEVYRTNTIAHAAVETRVSNEIGSGIKPQAKIEDQQEANLALEKLFRDWSIQGVDKKRTMSFFEFERAVNRSLGIYGEAFVLFSQLPSDTLSLTLEIVSPKRIETPAGRLRDRTIRNGVQYDKNGTVIGYWVRSTEPGDIWQIESPKWEMIPRFDSNGQVRMLHVFETDFPGQHRGIPWLAPALPRIKDLDDWYEAELIAKQIEACFGIVFTGSEDGVSPMDVAEANSSIEVNGRRLETIEPGMVHYASSGETVTTIDPQRPGGTFVPFVERTLRSIASTLNIPYELMAKDYFRTTFSSGQLAMLDGRNGFKLRRQTMIDGFLIPFWRRFVDDAVFENEALGTIDISAYVADKKAYTEHDWVAPGWGFLNPRDEVKAITEALNANITTMSTVYAERGQDFDTQIAKRRDELLRLAEIEVEVRAYKRDLEEAADLPSENDAVQSDGMSGAEEESNQNAEDQVVENQP